MTNETPEVQEPEEKPPTLPEPPAEAALVEAPKAPGAAAKLGELLKVNTSGVQLSNLTDLATFSRMVVVGGVAPKWAYAGVGANWTYEQTLRAASGAVGIAIQAGLEHGLGVLGGLQAFIVIEGKLTWAADAAAAKIRNSPVCKPGTLRFWCEGEGQAMKGVAVAWRVGYKEPSRAEFTYHDAVRANLLGKKNWRSYPTRMYQWRALSWLARDVFSDVLGGFPLAEEVEDFDVRTVTRSDRAAAPLTGALPPAAATHPLMQDLGAPPKKEEPEPVFVPPPVVEVEAQTPGEIKAAPKVISPPREMTHAEADAAIAAEEGQSSLFPGRKRG